MNGCKQNETKQNTERPDRHRNMTKEAKDNKNIQTRQTTKGDADDKTEARPEKASQLAQ